MTSSKRSPRKIVFLVSLLFLAVLAILAMPAYLSIKTWRASSLLKEAEIRIREGNLEKARTLTHSSSRLIPNHTAAYRLLALTYESSEPQLAILYWNAFWKTGNPTLADYHAFLHLLILSRDFKTADLLLTEALKLEPKNVETITLCARFALLTGDVVASFEFIREALLIAPNDRKARLLWVQLCLHAQESRLQKKGRSLMWELVSEEEDAYSLTALLEFSRIRPMSSHEATRLIEAILSHSLIKPWHLWEVRSFQFEFFPEERKDFLIKVIHQELERDPLALLRWLNQVEAYSETIKILEEVDPLSHVDFFHEYLRAMERSHRAPELIRLLKEKRTSIPLSVTSYEFALGNLFSQTEDAYMAPVHWDRARMNATPAELWQMGLSFEKRGITGEVIACMEKLRSFPNAFSKHFVTFYFKVLHQHGETLLMKELMEQAVAYFPDNLAIQNNLLYLRILLQEDIEQVVADAEKLWQDYPSCLPVLLTYAYALKSSGKENLASDLVEKWSDLFEKGSPEERIIFSYVMGSPPRAPLTAAELQRLLPEELDVYESMPIPFSNEMPPK